MQVVHFANSLVEARNDLQHKYGQTYYKALDVFSSFLVPSPPAHAGVLVETYLALELSGPFTKCLLDICDPFVYFGDFS